MPVEVSHRRRVPESDPVAICSRTLLLGIADANPNSVEAMDGHELNKGVVFRSIVNAHSMACEVGPMNTLLGHHFAEHHGRRVVIVGVLIFTEVLEVVPFHQERGVGQAVVAAVLLGEATFGQAVHRKFEVGPSVCLHRVSGGIGRIVKQAEVTWGERGFVKFQQDDSLFFRVSQEAIVQVVVAVSGILGKPLARRNRLVSGRGEVGDFCRAAGHELGVIIHVMQVSQIPRNQMLGSDEVVWIHRPVGIGHGGPIA